MIARDRPGLAVQALWLFGARVLAQASLVLFTIVVARRLGPAAFGDFAFVAAVLVVANVLTSFGTDMLLVREIAARRAAGDVSAALLLQVVLAAVALLLALAVPPLPGQGPGAMAALRVALAALFPLALYTILSAMLRGSHRIASVALVSAAAGVLQLVGALALVPAEGGTAVDVSVVIVLTQVAAALLAAVACVAEGIGLRPLWSDPRPHLVRLVRAASPIALLGLLGMLYQRATVLILSPMLGAAATGVFSAGSRAVEAAKIGHIAALGALYPALAEAEGTGADTRPRASLPALLALAAVAATALTATADPLVALLFGPGFAPAAEPLRILSWALVPYAFASHRSTALVAARREAEVARALAIALATLVVLCLWWIPAAGISGAAWATVVAEVSQAALLAIGPRTIPAVAIARPAGLGR